jgi:hypothetical protein
MTNEQKKAIRLIKLEQAPYLESVKVYEKLQCQIDKIFGQCKHEDYRQIVEDDEYEGRRFYRNLCNDCGYDWYGSKKQ